jgi:DNA-binding response OmpR family regulator
MNVLAVEDEALVTLELAQLIRGLGHDPIVAANGEEALRLVDLYLPKLVLVDIRIAKPFDDGIELAREIRGRHPCGLIFISGIGDAETKERAATVLPDAFVTKPFSSTALVRRMQELLSAS